MRPAFKTLSFAFAFALALAFAPAAQAQACLATLEGCTACVLPTGSVTLSDCGPGGGMSCPPFPASLLVADPDVEPGSLQALLVSRLFERWAPGEPVHDILMDGRRQFVQRAAWEAFGLLPEVIGSGAEWRRHVEAEVKALAADCLAHMTVRAVPNGTGGTEYAVVPRSTASLGECSSALLAWLPRQLGVFAVAELAPFAERSLAPTAEDEEHEELLLGLAAQLRELSADDLAVVIDGVALIGADEEGGRE